MHEPEFASCMNLSLPHVRNNKMLISLGMIRVSTYPLVQLTGITWSPKITIHRSKRQPLSPSPPTQLEILQDALADVRNLDNKKDRHRMVRQVRKRVFDLPDSKTLDRSAREELEAAIDSWFSVRSKRQSNKIKFAKTWTPRLVLYEEHKEKVNEIKSRLYEKAKRKGENPTRSFDYFQRAISKLWKQQSKTERKALEKLAKKWNKEGVSREQKQEYVIDP